MDAISDDSSDDLMNVVATTLFPLPAILWGDRAVGLQGAPIVCDHYIFEIKDADMQTAEMKLRSSGFVTCLWSYGSLAPDFYTQDDVRKRVYSSIIRSFDNLDRNSSRFLFPTEYQLETKVVLLPASYAHISFENDSFDTMPRLCINIALPAGKLLVRSFVQMLLGEPTQGMWTGTLEAWAISYAYGELRLGEDILDDCNDENAKAWFNKATKRSTGGLDCVTATKRLGRKAYGDKSCSESKTSQDELDI